MCLPFHEIVNVSTIFGEVFLLFFRQALTPSRGHESGAIVVVNAILEYVLQQIDSICIFTWGGGQNGRRHEQTEGISRRDCGKYVTNFVREFTRT